MRLDKFQMLMYRWYELQPAEQIEYLLHKRWRFRRARWEEVRQRTVSFDEALGEINRDALYDIEIVLTAIAADWHEKCRAWNTGEPARCVVAGDW